LIKASAREIELGLGLPDLRFGKRDAGLRRLDLRFQLARDTDVVEGRCHRLDDGNRRCVLLDRIARLQRQAHELARDRRRNRIHVLDAGLALLVHRDDQLAPAHLGHLDADGLRPQRPDQGNKHGTQPRDHEAALDQSGRRQLHGGAPNLCSSARQ
jgi:hypothetical protein